MGKVIRENLVLSVMLGFLLCPYPIFAQDSFTNVEDDWMFLSNSVIDEALWVYAQRSFRQDFHTGHYLLQTDLENAEMVGWKFMPSDSSVSMRYIISDWQSDSTYFLKNGQLLELSLGAPTYGLLHFNISTGSGWYFRHEDRLAARLATTSLSDSTFVYFTRQDSFIVGSILHREGRLIRSFRFLSSGAVPIGATTVDGEVVLVSGVEGEGVQVHRFGASLMEFRDVIIYEFPFSSNVVKKEEFKLGPDNQLLIYGRLFENQNSTERSAFLLTIEPDFDRAQLSQLSGSNFPYFDLDIVPKEDEYLVSYSTQGFFPCVSLVLDSNHQIVNQTGLPFFTPSSSLLRDTVYSTSFRLFDGEEAANRSIIARYHDPASFSCPTAPSCIESYSLPLVSNRLSLRIDSLQDSIFVHHYQGTPVSFGLEPNCGVPPVPQPFFELADEWCLGDSIVFDTIESEFATFKEWEVLTPDGQWITTELDSLDSTLRVAGTYLLRHTIWLLGCDYAHEQEVRVIAPEVGLITEGDVCDSFQLVSSVSNFMPNSYIWQDNSTDSTFQVTQSGIYSVTVTNGACVDSATIRVELIDDRYPDEKITPLRDTTLCTDFFPLTLTASSLYSDSIFLLETNSEQLVIETPGNYTVGVNLDGCLFTERIQVESNDCLPAIFVPNSFSPNGDGINDTWEAYGADFVVLAYRVYDRWGGILYEGTEAWDGRSGRNYVNPGVYLGELLYRNSRTNSERQERLVTEVVVVR